jgi:uncharacterized membrane protein
MINGQFCPKCGGASAGGAAQAAVAPAAVSGNVASMLCYFPILAIVFLLLAPYNKDKTVRFHALQSLGLAAGLFVLQIVLAIVTAILGSVSTVLAGPLAIVVSLVGLAGLLLFVLGMVKAYQGQKLWIPFLSPMAEKFV